MSVSVALSQRIREAQLTFEDALNELPLVAVRAISMDTANAVEDRAALAGIPTPDIDPFAEGSDDV